jgi:hypothetical protein
LFARQEDDIIPCTIVGVLPSGHHPEFCVKKRLFKEVHVRGYYRHRQFLENILPIFQKGGCHACLPEQAYHIVP